MTVRSATPKYLYKILSAAPPEPLPITLPLSELDGKDGFIHLSTAEQVPVTAGRFFVSSNVLWLLKIDLALVEKNVRWETSGSESFPHVYGPMPGSREVVDTKEFQKSDGEDWASVLGNSQWLIG